MAAGDFSLAPVPANDHDIAQGILNLVRGGEREGETSTAWLGDGAIERFTTLIAPHRRAGTPVNDRECRRNLR